MSDLVHLPPYTVDFLHVPQSAQDGVDWGVAAYGIPELWRRTQGEGVTVAVVDSGIAKHYAIDDVVMEHRNFSGDSDPYDSLGHGCIAPDDEVYTSACGVQKISTLFDRVDGVVHPLRDGSVVKDISRLGIYTLGYDSETQQTVRRKVLAVHRLPYKGSVIRVRTREGELTFTPWHPVYAQTSQRGDDRSVRKMRADELKVGQRLVASRTNDGVFSGLHEIHLSPKYVCRYCGREATKGDRKQCRGCDKSRWHDGPVSRSMPLNEDLAFFLGLIASDGHVMKSSRSVCFYNNSRALADVFEQLCIKLFGKPPKERDPDSRSPTRIDQRLHSAEAWSLCACQFGMSSDKSRTLEFPELIAKSSPGVIMSFVAGVIEGDGSVAKNDGRIRVATGSEKFAKRLVSVCRFLGMNASMAEVKPSRTGFATTRSSWAVRICHNESLAEKLRVKKIPIGTRAKGRRALSVVSIETQPYEGNMYDLTVEDSHNYAANGVIVSNTHVAGVIASNKGLAQGIAPKAHLLSLKVLGHSGMGKTEAVAAAVSYATEAKADIVCMSLGSTRPDARLHDVIRHAHREGVIIVCAAGNDGGAVNYPAAFAETVAVGAVNKSGEACEFSSRGKEISVAAPGQDITSTWLANGYATISGTSMAAPFVAGVLALFVSERKANGEKITHQDVVKALGQTSRDVGAVGKDDVYGWGLLDPAKLLTYTPQSVPGGVTIYIPGGKVV